MPIIDISGFVFGYLTAIKRLESKNRKSFWICECRCGKSCIIYLANLRNGHSKSCGCLRIEKMAAIATSHGHAKNGQTSSEYNSWANMKERCLNENHPQYRHWGGRGIKICQRWHSFDNFLADMGPKPSSLHSIDRHPNQNGDYEPGNSRWATMKEQQANRTNNRWLEYEGKKMLMTHWATLFGVSPAAVFSHLRRGKSMNEIVEFYCLKNYSLPPASINFGMF
jgi:hypothetical protein